MATRRPVPQGMAEIGETGLKHWSGRISEEWLRQLVGIKGQKIYREMRDNDSTVGAIAFVIEMLIRQVDWTVEAASEDPEDVEAAEFVDSCLQDMSQTWENTLAEVLSFLWHGFSYHEVVYKKREGPSADPSRRSKFTDGKIGWRKIPIRAQTTISKWLFDDEGGIQGAEQTVPKTGKKVDIPIDKALLFRTTSAKSNPEGRSTLRNAFRPWYFRKRVEEVEGVGIERDLAGLPEILCPARIMDPSASADEKALYELFKTIVRNVRRDEQHGIIMPSDRDAQGNLQYEFKLVTTGGQRQVDTNVVVQRYKAEIAQTVVADFILLGHEKVGSFALSEDKSGLFATALSAWLDEIASVFNRHAIPRLLALNGYDLEIGPKLTPGEVKPPDLQKLGMFVKETSAAGMEWFPDERLENRLRSMARLPEKQEEMLDQ